MTLTNGVYVLRTECLLIMTSPKTSQKSILPCVKLSFPKLVLKRTSINIYYNVVGLIYKIVIKLQSDLVRPVYSTKYYSRVRKKLPIYMLLAE